MLKKILCYLIGHGSKYKYRIDKADGKTYEITVCHRCWKEKEKVVE